MLNETPAKQHMYLRAGDPGYGTTCPSCQGQKARRSRSCSKCGQKTSAEKHRKYTSDTKYCPDCETQLPVEAFNRKLREPSGRQPICRTCASKRNKTWRAEYPELAKQRGAASRQRHRDYYRDRALRSTVGITLEHKQQMYAAQNGRCAICQQHFESLDVDHDHTTGKVRALLCNNCNRGIGHLQDKAEILRAAAAYLEEHTQC